MLAKNHPLFIILPGLTTPWCPPDIPDVENIRWEQLFQTATPYQRTNISHCWLWCLANSKYFADPDFSAVERDEFITRKMEWLLEIKPYVLAEFVIWKNLGYASNMIAQTLFNLSTKDKIK